MDFDVLVLGVGGMGAAALAHCASRGLSAIGIEQNGVPNLRGSSAGQTRIIRKAYYEDARYVPLLHRAYELWDELDARPRSVQLPLFTRTGCLNLGPAAHPDILGVLESTRIHALPHVRLDEAALRERFPMFAPSPGDIGVYEEDAGYLRPERCTIAHAQKATELGAVVRTRTEVTQLEVRDGDVRAVVESRDGTEEITAKHLVLSAGPWLNEFPTLAADLPPVRVTRQIQLWFAPRDAAQAASMPAFIHFTGARAYYGLPVDQHDEAGAHGIKVCRHHGGEVTTPAELDRALRPADERDVRNYIDAHLSIADGPLVHHQVCMYTTTPDAHFIVGLHPRHSHVVVLGGFSGHGYKMASVMGEIAADLVEHRRTAFDIALFDPRRR